MPPRRRSRVASARPAPESRTQRITATATAIAALGALLVSAVSIYYTGRSVDATLNQVRLQEQGQITDRFANAVEQLGSDQVNVRMGGIYSLERLMRDSPEDRSTIVQVLCAFVRESAKNRRYDASKPFEWPNLDQYGRSKPAGDVQAAVTVLGRRSVAGPIEEPPVTPLPGYAKPVLDLSFTDLSFIDMSRGDFAFTDFKGSSLVGADMAGANLTKANLFYADLAAASLIYATAPRATFAGARIKWGWFGAANFSEADFREADAEGVRILGSNLTGASFDRANLANAEMEDAQLLSATFTEADLRGADLLGAKNFHLAGCVKTSEKTRLPVGFNLPRC